MDTRTTTMADLAKRICDSVAACTDEAKTKQYAIIPVFRALGWDDTDPRQIAHEVQFRLPGASPTWCDYAFIVGGEQAVLIEAKQHAKNLDPDYRQLHDYFGQSRAVLAILTDGQRWRFYSDLDRRNAMDHNPFHVIDMCDLREGDEEFLRAFRREGFEAGAAIRARALRARESERLRERLRRWLDKALANPSDALVRLAMTESDYDGRRGQAEIDSWRAGIRSAFADVKGATLAIDKERAEVTGSEYRPPRDLATPLTAPGKQDSGMPTRRAKPTKPDGFRLLGRNYPAKKWNEVWYGVAEALYGRHPDRFRDVVGRPRGKRSYVEVDRQMLNSPTHRVRDSQYWVGGHGNASTLRERCVNLLELLGYGQTDIEFFYADR